MRTSATLLALALAACTTHVERRPTPRRGAGAHAEVRLRPAERRRLEYQRMAEAQQTDELRGLQEERAAVLQRQAEAGMTDEQRRRAALERKAVAEWHAEEQRRMEEVSVAQEQRVAEERRRAEEDRRAAIQVRAEAQLIADLPPGDEDPKLARLAERLCADTFTNMLQRNACERAVLTSEGTPRGITAVTKSCRAQFDDDAFALPCVEMMLATPARPDPAAAVAIKSCVANFDDTAHQLACVQRAAKSSLGADVIAVCVENMQGDEHQQDCLDAVGASRGNNRSRIALVLRCERLNGTDEDQLGCIRARFQAQR